MKKIKNKIKDDFINNLDVDLKFDTSKLKMSNNENKQKINFKKVMLVTCVVLIVGVISIPVGTFLSIAINVEENFKGYKKQYSIHELNSIQEDSFIKLNDIKYPDGSRKKHEINEEFVDSINKFSYNVYKESYEENTNFSYSPITLYSNLSILSLASDKASVNNKLDDLLCSNKETRTEFYKKVYENNFYANSEGTTQMYNGLFTTSKYQVNSEFIGKLSDYFCEAYQLDFSNTNNVRKMLMWVDEKVLQENYINPNDLNITDESSMYIFSTLYFDNTWSFKYHDKDTKQLDFYLNDGSTVKADFMHHTYFTDKIYDYGNYISVKDYYKNNYSIKYIVPKKIDDNIYDLLNGVNFLIDDETCKIVSSTDFENITINLSAPKFDTTATIDFTSSLANLGLDELFDPFSHSFDYAFSSLDNNTSIYLDFLKQKNTISFNEDGTVVKSVSFSGFKAGDAGPIEADTYEINLNQPFVYVIYDNNEIPIYIGHMDNPKAK